MNNFQSKISPNPYHPDKIFFTKKKLELIQEDKTEAVTRRSQGTQSTWIGEEEAHGAW